MFKIPQEGTGLGDQVVSGITQVARYTKFDVTTELSGTTTSDDGTQLPAGKNTRDFLKSVVPVDSTAPPAPPVFAKPTISGNSFTGVVPGSYLQFKVNVENDFAPALATPQVFRAKIKVLAGGCADLDEREVLILIPPKAPVIG